MRVPVPLVRLTHLLLFWLVPLLIPAFIGLRLWRAHPVPVESAGIAWLALPIELATAGNPLQGWSRFDPPVPAPAAPVADIKDAPAPAAMVVVPAAFPIEIHGQVGHGGAAVYCFFDTDQNSWFRMAPGDTDARRRLSLEPASAGDGLQLVDLSSGRRYRVQPGRRQPELIPE